MAIIMYYNAECIYIIKQLGFDLNLSRPIGLTGYHFCIPDCTHTFWVIIIIIVIIRPYIVGRSIGL